MTVVGGERSWSSKPYHPDHLPKNPSSNGSSEEWPDSTCEKCSVNPSIHMILYSLRLCQIYLIQSTVKMQEWSKETGICELSYGPAKIQTLHCSISNGNRLISRLTLLKYRWKRQVWMAVTMILAFCHTLIFFLFSFVFRLFSFPDIKFRKFAIVPPRKYLSIDKNLKTRILAK